MVLLPALYIACALAKERVTVCGDFHQLPPIVQSKQEAILNEIGPDVFRASGVRAACLEGQVTDRVVMLDTQHRMVEPICALVSGAMDYKRLRTGESVRSRAGGPRPPVPFDGPLTVVDTSQLWPFECRTSRSSRFNLMHALLIRNLCAQRRRVPLGQLRSPIQGDALTSKHCLEVTHAWPVAALRSLVHVSCLRPVRARHAPLPGHGCCIRASAGLQEPSSGHGGVGAQRGARCGSGRTQEGWHRSVGDGGHHHRRQRPLARMRAE